MRLNFDLVPDSPVVLLAGCQPVPRLLTCLTELVSGGIKTMRMRRVVRSVSTFTTQLFAALLKAVITSMVLGLIVVTIMHHMGVPVPSMSDLLRGVSRLADVLS